MSTQMERLAIELLALPTASRALLANQLLASLDDADAPEISAEWLAEIDRRDAQIRDGSVQCVPADEVMRRARERVK